MISSSLLWNFFQLVTILHMIHLCNLEMLETIIEKTYWYVLVPNAKLGTFRRYCFDVTPVRFLTLLQVLNCSYTVTIIEFAHVSFVPWV
jgi:hypothetical protein